MSLTIMASTTMKSIIVVFAVLVAQAAAQRRDLRSSGGKMSSTKAPAGGIPRCTAHGSTTQSGKMSGRSGKMSSRSKASKSPCSPTKIECGGSFVNQTITLDRTLGCDAATLGGQAALTLTGGDAVLDCQGNWIVDPGRKSSFVAGAGVELRDGATAKNCFVKGFRWGFFLNGGNSIVLDSEAIWNEEGVKTRGVGEMLLERVRLSGNQDEGIDMEHAGAMDLIDVDIFANRVDGISIDTRTPDGNVPTEDTYICVYSENLQSIANGDQNIRAVLNRPTLGVDLRMTGNTRLIDANDDNLDMGGAGMPNTGLYDGNFEVSYALNDGFGLKEGSHTFSESATVYACNNAVSGNAGDGDFDFTPSNNGVTFMDLTNGQGITCGLVDGAPPGFLCMPGCPVDGTVSGAICNV